MISVPSGSDTTLVLKKSGSAKKSVRRSDFDDLPDGAACVMGGLGGGAKLEICGAALPAGRAKRDGPHRFEGQMLRHMAGGVPQGRPATYSSGERGIIILGPYLKKNFKTRANFIGGGFRVQT